MTPPLDPALRERLGRIHTGSLSDAMGSFGVPAPGLRPITPGARLLGPAYTVKCYPGSILTVHKALLEAPPGVVLVVDDEGDTRGALWGEVMTHQAIRQGVLGLVTDGGTRASSARSARGSSWWICCSSGSWSPAAGSSMGGNA